MTFALRGSLLPMAFPSPFYFAGNPAPAILKCLDLLPSRSSAFLFPEAVAEFQGRPVIYLLNAKAADEACHHDPGVSSESSATSGKPQRTACLGIVRPGQLDVYPVNLDRKQLAEGTPRTILQSAPNAPIFFQSLAAGAIPLEGQPKEAGFCFSRNPPPA